MSGNLVSASHCDGTGLIPQQFTWDLWLTGRTGRSVTLRKYFSFLPSFTSPLMFSAYPKKKPSGMQ